MVTGMRSRPTSLPVNSVTSGPGPLGPVAAARTRIEMLGSSSISFKSSSRREPSRSTSTGIAPDI